jgi:putative transposase
LGRVGPKGGLHATLCHTDEQILAKSRAVEVALAMGQSVAHVSRARIITEQTCNLSGNEYGSLKVDQIKRLKALEWENICLKRAIADPLRRSARHPEMLHV